jgi:hypothetical protein
MADKSTPAFPFELQKNDYHFEQSTGMTLRDYFAGQVLGGISHTGGVWEYSTTTAEYAYRIADAMLKAREKSND